MQFSHLAEYLEKLEKISSRLAITEILAELILESEAKELGEIMYLLQGRVVPQYGNLEFGLADKFVIRAISEALSFDKAEFEKVVKAEGDLGSAAEKAKIKSEIKVKRMSVSEVFEKLTKIAQASGAGSQEVKVSLLAQLVSDLDPRSVRYLVRIPTGGLRLGASDTTMMDAMSWAITGGKTMRPAIEKAYQVRPDLGFIATQIKKEFDKDGKTWQEKVIKTLAKVTPNLFTPIMMMKAERLSSGVEIIEKISTAAVEPKYDGLRLQVHFKRHVEAEDLPKAQAVEQADLFGQSVESKVGKRAKVAIFTRGLEDATFMYPDVAHGVIDESVCEEAIFEGEAVGFNPETGHYLPFQETTQRKRKHGITEKMVEIPLKFFAFDILSLNGESLIDKPFETRRKKLIQAFKNAPVEGLVTSKKTVSHTVIISPMELVSDPEILEKRFNEYVSEGLEGIMAKKLDDPYKPGARGYTWVKLKRSYSDKVTDTVDCLVMGYDYGKGKRASFGIGAVLVGVYDTDKEEYLTVAKIGTGLTDDEWRELRKKSDVHKTSTLPENYNVDKLMDCDVWVKPAIVLEIRADELTISKMHTSGYGMRFPRLERFRDDKKPKDVTDTTELKNIALVRSEA